MGYPEMVVNSDWRSGLFSSVGRSVFSSQARSFAEGSRVVAGASPVVMVVVVPLTFSLMVWRSQYVRVPKLTSKEPRIPCYAKAKSGARGPGGRGAHKSAERNRARPESLQLLFGLAEEVSAGLHRSSS